MINRLQLYATCMHAMAKMVYPYRCIPYTSPYEGLIKSWTYRDRFYYELFYYCKSSNEKDLSDSSFSFFLV